MVKVLPAPEQGKFIPVGAGVIGAEGGAVAAFVAHAVHVDDLPLPLARHRHRHVGPVGTDLGAGLTHRGAAQTAAVAAVGAQLSPLGQGRLIVGADVGPGVLAAVQGDDGAGGPGGVGDGLHHRGRAPSGIAHGKDAGDAGLHGLIHHRAALLVQSDAVGGQERAVHLLAHGGDDGGGGDGPGLAGGHRRAAARRVGGPQFHHPAGQNPVLHPHGGEQLQELHPVGQGQGQLLLVGGHVAPGTAVDQPDMLHAGDAPGGPGGVHGGVAAADDRYVGPQVQGGRVGLGLLQERQDAARLAVIQPGRARLPGSGGEDDVGEALGLQLAGGLYVHTQHKFGPHGPAQGHVPVDGLVRDAEGGDDVADDAAQGLPALKDGDVDSLPGQEEGGGQAGGSAAHHGHPLAGDRGLGAQPGQQGVIAAPGGLELHVPDADRLLVVIAHALVRAVVGADGAGDEGQGVALEDDLQGPFVVARPGGHQIGRDILLNGAAAPAGGFEAVDEGHLPAVLPVGQGLDGLAAGGPGAGRLRQGGHLGGIHAGEGGTAAVHQLPADLAQALVAAGLEDGGGHGDGPDARVEQAPDVGSIGPAGVGDAQPAVKLRGDALSQGEGEGVQGPAGHIHLLAGQLSRRHVHREGVGQLDAELQALRPGKGGEAAEHGHRVGPLEILRKVVAVKDHVVEAQVVQGPAGKFVAQQGGVALDVGVEPLLGDEVGGDALDLVGGAAVEGGLGDGGGHLGGDGLYIGRVHLPEPVQIGQGPVHTGIPNRRGGGVLHALDVGVDLFALNAGQVVPHRHIEHKTVRVAQIQLPGQQLAGEPRLDVLVVGLGHGELGGPLAVVALVLRRDAGLGHALAQRLAVHDLDRLEFKKAASGGVGRHQVLGQLGVGAGGGAVGGFDLLSKDGQGLAVDVADQLGHAEDAAVGAVFGQNPVHERTEGDGTHDVAHMMFLLLLKRWKNSVGAVVQLAPELLALLQGPGVDGLLVQVHEFPVPVDHLAVDDGGAAVFAHHAEEHVTVQVLLRKGGEGLVVHDDHVGGGPGLQHAQGLLEEAGGNLGVVLEEHLHGFAPAHVGQAGVVPLDEEEDLQALQHVVGVGVGAHAHQNALLEHLEHRGAAHRVAHVGLRVVDHHGPRLLQDVQLGGGEVDAVA